MNHLFTRLFSQTTTIYARPKATLLRGFDADLNRMVGIKIIKHLPVGLAEARRMAFLQHPAAMSLYETFSVPDLGQVLLHEWMEPIPWVQGFAKLSALKRLAAWIPLLDYLVTLHAHGRYHGFLSPHSVWFCPESECFHLADFARPKCSEEVPMEFWIEDHKFDRLGPWTDCILLGVMATSLCDLLSFPEEWLEGCCRAQHQRGWTMRRIRGVIRDRWSDEQLMEEMDFHLEAARSWASEWPSPSD